MEVEFNQLFYDNNNYKIKVHGFSQYSIDLPFGAKQQDTKLFLESHGKKYEFLYQKEIDSNGDETIRSYFEEVTDFILINPTHLTHYYINKSDNSLEYFYDKSKEFKYAEKENLKDFYEKSKIFFKDEQKILITNMFLFIPDTNGFILKYNCFEECKHEQLKNKLKIKEKIKEEIR